MLSGKKNRERKRLKRELEIEAAIREMCNGVYYYFQGPLNKIAAAVAEAHDERWQNEAFLPKLKFIYDHAQEIISDAINHSDMVRTFKEMLQNGGTLVDLERISRERKRRNKERIK